MPQPKEYDLSPIRATIITFSDRVLSGQREARGARASGGGSRAPVCSARTRGSECARRCAPRTPS